MTMLLIIIALTLALIGWRRYWMHTAQPRVYTSALDAEVYRVGETHIAIRRVGNPSRTVICFPGFLEDMRYFIDLYAESDCQLILCNNAAYHLPVDAETVKALQWPANPYAVGTIEHDGFYLGHVLQELASGDDIVLHGHSRGGAVVLEAGRQFPELMRSEERTIRAVLEAAVLPGGRTAGRGSEPAPYALIRFFLPIVLGLSRKGGKARRESRAEGPRPGRDVSAEAPRRHRDGPEGSGPAGAAQAAEMALSVC